MHRGEKKHMRTKSNEEEEAGSRGLPGSEILNSATSALQREQSGGVRVTALCTPRHSGNCERGRASSEAAITKPTALKHGADGGGAMQRHPPPPPKTLPH